LLHDGAAGDRGIVIEAGLQTAELIQHIVNIAVDRSDIDGLRWLPALRRGGGTYGKAAEEETYSQARA
jgi:hypothetical protein